MTRIHIADDGFTGSTLDTHCFFHGRPSDVIFTEMTLFPALPATATVRII